MNDDIKQTIKGMWWAWVLAGIASVMFGLGAMLMPGLTAVGLLTMTIAFLLIWGVVEMVQGFMQISKNKKWWITVLGGLLTLVVGVFLARYPGVSVVTFSITVGCLLIFRGAFDLVSMGMFERTNKVLWIISSVLSIIAGVSIIFHPLSGTIAFAWVLGLYALINGAVMIARAMEVRAIAEDIKQEVKTKK